MKRSPRSAVIMGSEPAFWAPYRSSMQRGLWIPQTSGCRRSSRRLPLPVNTERFVRQQRTVVRGRVDGDADLCDRWCDLRSGGRPLRQSRVSLGRRETRGAVWRVEPV